MIDSPNKKSAPKKTPSKKKAAVKKAAEKKPRVRNPEQTRAKLLQATIDLLAEKGPAGVSLKDAARYANVSRGVAYQHFDDRDHLLSEAKAWISEQLLESAKGILPALKKKDINQVMDESVYSVAQIVLNNREAARLLITDALAGKALDAEHPLYKMVVTDLEELQTSGVAKRNFDIEILTFIMLGSVATIIMLSHLPHPGDTDSLAQRFSMEWTRLLREGMIGKTALSKSAKPARKALPPATKTKVKTKGRPKR